MLDWLAVWGVAQAGALIFKPILEDLAKDAAKDWAKDLLKGILNKNLEKLKKEEIEIAAGKALKEFLQLMQQQLKVRCKLSEEEIKDYTEDIKKFISDKSVKEILGKAFDISCEDLNFKVLEDSWKRLQLKTLPPKFNWQAFIDQYFIQVQELLQESEELRSILELQKLSSIDNTLKEIADIPKDFNLAQYLETIRERYGNLKLDSLENTSREHPVNLWQIFIPQNVRQVYQVLPELPKEYLRRLQESNQLDAEFEIEKIKEELEGYKRNYLEQPIRSVLDVIRQDKPRKNYLVILGDPGSGKSTLLQYLALDWVEKTLTQNDFNLPIPLLIELRNYVRDREAGTCNNFLEYYHKGPNCFFHLNQHKLHEQLKAGNALVMFDGLDEIFELTKREEVITSIHRFTNEYPDVQVIVTSRIIGYKQQQLRDAEFRHFMLQDLEPAQIKDFIERWHDKTFSQAEARDKNIKRERIQRVINESKAIAELAQNPLLLTMMAILNLKRELPRDRNKLYEDASEVLLHNWDEGRNLKPDERLEDIYYKDKQAILRQVAYQMQTSEKGLAGNIIHGDALEAIFTKYLQSIPVSDVRDKARRLMKQLRGRNFILCFLGEDYYAFVHRTFLEYFCAKDFVKRFEKRGTVNGLTLEQLKTDVFGKHWHDETWHEVLLLIAGMIEAEFLGEVLDYLMAQNGEEEKFINLFLAAKCLAEVRNRSVIAATANKLLKQLKDLTKYDLCYYYLPYEDEEETKLVQEIRTQAVAAVTKTWKQDLETKSWLRNLIITHKSGNMRRAAIQALARNFADDPDMRNLFQHHAIADKSEKVQRVAIQALARNFPNDPNTRIFFLNSLANDDSDIRLAAMRALAKNFSNDPDTRSIFLDLSTADKSKNVRRAAIQALARNFPNDPDTHTLLEKRATTDYDSDVRYAVIEILASNFANNVNTYSILQDCATADDNSDVRLTAIQALIRTFPDDINTLTILQDRAIFDKYWNVRLAAIQGLAKNFRDDANTFGILQDRAIADNNSDVRLAAIRTLARSFRANANTYSILQNRATADNNSDVRFAAMQALASTSNFSDDINTITIPQDRTSADDNSDVQLVRIQELASNNNFSDNINARKILQDYATAHDYNVRSKAIQTLAKHFKYQPELFDTYYNCAVSDPFERKQKKGINPRRVALEIIIKQYPQHFQTLPLLRDRAENDPDKKVRAFAQQKLKEWEG